MTRRKLTGRPLLVASGLLLAAGCPHRGSGEPPVGNLMGPMEPVSTLCVNVVPSDVGVVVEINGVVASNRCLEVTGWGDVHVRVTAPGYAEQRVEVPFSLEMEPVLVNMTGLPPQIEPVGNLMAPPRVR
jgi:hypothetical protein